MTTADPLQTEPPMILVDDPDGYVESTGWVQVTEKTPTGATAAAFMEEVQPRADLDEDTIYVCDDKKVWLKMDLERAQDTGEEHWQVASEEDPEVVLFWEITVGCSNA